MDKNFRELTKAEREVMQIYWELGAGFVNDIIDRMPEPKPAYNTVSTVSRILVNKGFLGYKAYGKSHQYYPAVSKEEYTEGMMHSVMQHYFDNSFKQLVSFFSQKEKVSIQEMEEILALLKKEEDAKNL